MAAVSLVYTVVGNKPNEKSTTEIHFTSGFNLSQYTGYAIAFATLLNNLIGGKILDATLNFGVDLSTLSSNTAETFSDVEEVAAFEFVSEQGNPVKLNIPALIETAVIDTTHDLDQTDARVGDVIAMMEEGIAVTGGTIVPCDVGEDPIAGVIYARERSKNSGARS